jgi:hypothetical protein
MDFTDTAYRFVLLFRFFSKIRKDSNSFST